MSSSASSSPPPPSVASPGLGEVTIVSVPEVRVVALRAVVENYRAQKNQWQQLHAFCKAHNLVLDGPSRTIYYDEGFKAADVDLEVCLQLHADAKVPASDVAESEVKERVLPAFEKVASLTLIGPYEELPNAYRKLYAWRQHVDVAAAGPVREVYRHADYADDPTGKSFVTELQLPIAAP
uniref:AraC effector-binding domain-containing protein n=1 Tax=Globisporangium ultimum (strain ATCC 200006 / CBS 805.95 / DAOM BR144) TaxID=431595 RepID=K3X5B5_GLOUD